MEPITRRDLLKKATIAGSSMLLAASQGEAQSAEKAKEQSNAGAKDAARENMDIFRSTGPTNSVLDRQNVDSVTPPETDDGDVQTFKYPYSFAHKKVTGAGWARQVTIKDLEISKNLAGVNMRVQKHGCRELHWHESGEWSYMLAGNARVTCIDYEGKAYVDDIGPGDLWYFPSGVPHSIQGLEPDGCEFLLVFDDGTFSEYQTFLLSEWLAHTPKDILAQNFGVPESALAHVPKKELYIFPAAPPAPLAEARRQAANTQGYSPLKFTYHIAEAKPLKQNKGGEVVVVDSKVFPISTTVAAAIVTVKPGGLREMHWHPNSDEWQLYIKGEGSLCVFPAGSKARTMSVQAGDVGYIPITQGHFIKNTGDGDLVFLEIFKSDYYADFSLTQWLTHTPASVVMSHMNVDQATYDAMTKNNNAVVPARV